MIEIVLLIMLLAPATAALSALVVELPRLAEMVNLIAALIVFTCVLSLPFIVRGTIVLLHGYIGIEPLSAWVLLCTGIVYLLASIYAVGYMRLLGEPDRLPRFYMLFATFALTMLLAPLMNNIGLYWIAIELTTLVSTFLIGFEHEAEAIEAAWKYIMIVSAGISSGPARHDLPLLGRQSGVGPHLPDDLAGTASGGAKT